MNRILIDNEKQVDESKLTFADLNVHYSTGQEQTISGSGRDRKTRYRTGMQTNIGDIEISLWQKLVRNLIVRSEEQVLFKNLLQWEKEHSFYVSNDKDLEGHTMVLHAARIFDDKDWVHYKLFNERFRSEILRSGG